MPLYRCSVSPGLTSYEQRSRIAKEVTRIRCEITKALPLFVHTFFGEDREGRLPPGKRAFLLRSIRAGRTPEQKQRLAAEMTSALAGALGIAPAEIAVVTVDVPARWVMEGGEILPEPGEAAAWISRRAEPPAASISARVKPKRASSCAPGRSVGSSESGSRTGERTTSAPRSRSNARQ
jgi:phenylpyruvate tautomerase PptA (4-oxalocrotonate tautomerase family)